MCLKLTPCSNKCVAKLGYSVLAKIGLDRRALKAVHVL
jgi:hypothetical protein